MISDLLLDIDGTLIDTKKIFYLSLNDTLRENNLPETEDITLFGMSVQQALEKLGISHIKGIKQEWEEKFSRMSLSLGFYDGIIPMAKKAHESGIGIYLITSRSHITADPIIEYTELGPYIKGCIAAEDTINHKPYPDPILKAVEVFSLDTKGLLYVGDTNIDFQASTAANIRFAIAGWNELAEKDCCKNILANPMDIFALISEEIV